MSVVLTVIEWLLIPAGLLPVLTMIVLRRYRKAESQALRDRWHLAVVLAGLGAATSLIATFALLDLPIGWLWVPFGVMLLGADVVSGKWLIDFWRGKFSAPE